MNENKVNNDNKNLKATFAIIFFIALIVSLANKFMIINIPENMRTLYMFEVKGAKLVLISAQFYIYSIFTKKNNIYLISSLMLFIGYGYTLYSLREFYLALGENSKVLMDYLEFGFGFYGYIGSFIILVINILIPGSGFKIKYKYKVQSNYDNINDEYILATYIYGLYKRADLYEKMCVIVSKRDEKDLHIFMESDDKVIINILYNNLVAINLKSKIIMNEEQKQITTNDAADMLLLTSLFGNWGTFAYQYSNDFNERLNTYRNVKFNKIYEIEIVYFLNNTEQKLLLKTKENPVSFLEKFKDKLHN